MNTEIHNYLYSSLQNKCFNLSIFIAPSSTSSQMKSLTSRQTFSKNIIHLAYLILSKWPLNPTNTGGNCPQKIVPVYSFPNISVFN